MLFSVLPIHCSVVQEVSKQNNIAKYALSSFQIFAENKIRSGTNLYNISAKMKYCVVKCCKYFKGTNGSLKMFRCPKQPDLARRWVAAIGIGGTDFASKRWSICCEHFKDEDFERKDKSRLRPQAIPSIKLSAVDSTNNEIFQIDGNVDCASLVVEYLEYPEANFQNSLDENVIVCCHETSGMNPYSAIQPCEECASKQSIIEKMSKRISELEKLLKKCRNKVYYLDTTKTKLASSLLKLKTQQITNARQHRTFEVDSIHYSYPRTHFSEG